MTIPIQNHSWVSPKCAVSVSPLGGRGVYAVAPIAEGEMVCVWGGVVITSDELAKRRGRQPEYDNRCIAVHRGFWFAPPWPEQPPEPSELFNHSCEPNAGIRGQAVLAARRPIRVGEEVTFDYETAETDLLPFRCQCGSPRCRRVIDGNASHDPEFRRRHAGFLSWHIDQRASHSDAGGESLPRPPKRYTVAVFDGQPVRVVERSHFYAAQTGDPARGLGLYCDVDLEPGDVWWANDLEDPRWVSRMIPWEEFEALPEEEKGVIRTLCYIDPDRRAVVLCAEPFGRVNHAGTDANSSTDSAGHSVATRPIPAGTEITIPYTYEAVVSLLWEFPEFREYLPAGPVDELALLMPVAGHSAAERFLDDLGRRPATLEE